MCRQGEVKMYLDAIMRKTDGNGWRNERARMGMEK